MTEVVLVGNNLAVLVAADDLGAAGREVVLLTDGRAPGGHFRGLSVEGSDFDVGSVLLDRAPPTGPAGDPGTDLRTYDPERRYDWTRFGTLVDDWVAEQVDTRRTPTPEALVEGRRWPDHLMANRLDVVAASSLRAPDPLPREAPEHAAGKISSRAYDTLTYAAAAAVNHGPEVQGRLVDPFAAKVLGNAREGLLARYHRTAWLPLYWPETVADACEGRPTGLPENPFWTTSSGFVGELVRALQHRVAALPHVHQHTEAVDSLVPVAGGYELRTRDGRRWTTVRPVLGLAPDRARALVGLPDRPRAPGVSVLVVFCLVRGAAIGGGIGSMAVVDPDYLTYRLSDQDVLAGLDPEWHRVVAEAGPAVVARAQAGEDVAAVLVTELGPLLGVDAADVRVLRTLAAPNAVTVPTAESVAADASAREELAAAAQSAVLTGALLGTGATSMNDQIVQGLAVADTLR